MDEEKFIQRVENMVYYICGCSEKEATIILEKCLQRAKNGAVEYKNRDKNSEERMKFVEFWANYIRTHLDKKWSRQQNVLIDSQIQHARALVKDEN